jgi:hypothetical protein
MILIIAFKICIMLQYLILPTNSAINFFSCKGVKPWEVDLNDSAIAQAEELIQDYLYAWQHNHNRCRDRGKDEYFANYGIGNGLLRSVITFQRALEAGKIYRPREGYFWAQTTPDCTHNRTALDCYFKGLSSCGLFSNVTGYEPLDRSETETRLGRVLGPVNNLDICKLAEACKKPMSWIAGQYLKYIIRFRDKIKAQIDRRKAPIFDDVNRKSHATIAVHYRSGVLDENRVVLSLLKYMEAVKLKAHELAKDGRPVSVVFMSSKDVIKDFKSPEHLANVYGGNFTYRFLPVMEKQISANTSNDIEEELTKNPNIPREPYFVEYMTDIQLMVEADAFIGSVSTVYFVIMLLRYARNPKRSAQKYTCVMHDHGLDLVCEDDPRKYKVYNRAPYWRTNDHFTYETHTTAFQGGGVPF